ncbi:MAG: outer membrane protein assembly factor BamD [Acidobacteria bacterium]|nr:outer membrane protein assembly factor BamD [Acidobacteriota bacterium]
MRMKIRSFFPSNRTGFLAGLAVAALLSGTTALYAQDATQSQAATATQTSGEQTPAADQSAAPAQASATLSTNTSRKKHKKPKVDKADRVQETKDTKAELKKEAKYNPLVGKDQQLPDKQLYDKAMKQINSGHYDIGRLDLQTLLDTYPDSQYMMRAKLAVADAWYKEGGSAALTEAEQEYKDFITFFPNVPEAAEAQLRVGDIYFKQMDVPDRDYSKGVHAEEEYRTMLKQYPDAPPKLIAEAQQKLREVQEVMAEREAELGSFYATHANWAAAIARYQTVADTYPLYSHMDDVLIGIGDAYEAEANIVRGQPVCTSKPTPGVRCLPEGVKSKLLQEYDGKAAADYDKVVLYHSAAPHVEDAKERLTGMGLPIPTPTPEEVASSEALESSRAQYNLQKRIQLFFMHMPDTVTTAQVGTPTLDDPPPTLAPSVVRSLVADYKEAYNPAATPAPASGAPAASTAASSDAGAAATPAPPASDAPPTLSDVPTEGAAAADSSTKTVTVEEPGNGGGDSGATTGMGVEVLTPTSSPAPAREPHAGSTITPNGTPASSLPAATGAPDPNYGLATPNPKVSPLPPVEKPAPAPDQINDAEGKAEPAAQTAPEGLSAKKLRKLKAPKQDKSDESSSKNKPKKGLDKFNPF